MMLFDRCAIVKSIVFAGFLSMMTSYPAGTGAAETGASAVGKLPWGGGIYGLWGGPTELDKARWDWMVLNAANNGPEYIQELNRLLEINPRQKYFFQLGGIESGGLPENAGVSQLPRLPLRWTMPRNGPRRFTPANYAHSENLVKARRYCGIQLYRGDTRRLGPMPVSYAGGL